ncbi:Predicted PurR-regulated permease PerM [Parageobacillus thermantarcticus]|uniref:Predicted PurR-regulated permease PerM n=1 Tax=Parageobacillus thermantarcticus TaxID=186116 RepID=A0A1I0SM32_9BACL|nr:AI-2E family transporter [Parageobacillus thermantarcticus]SFA40570.1 Predicted PurR-regulated permease PerM [Parageobacillus thermantarcticus]
MGSEILQFFKRSTWKRIVIFSILIFILYLVRSILNIILLTFIFSFLMNGLVDFIAKRIRVNRKLVVLLLYAAVVSILVYGVVKYLPVVVNEISQLIKQLTEFYSKPQDNIVFNYIIALLKQYEITTYLNFGMTYLIKYFSDIGSVGLQILLALILSLFFLLEKERIISFTNRFKYSKIGPFYDELEYFGKKFARTFGKVIEAQFIIATINMAITVAFLWIMGFPQLFGLGILVFFLGLIPVAGVIISLFPLCFIAYSIGGVMKVVYVLMMIAVVHALEAYVLNPKLMSSKTNLPVFYTFIVLIFSEHFFGVWGLILGIPVFVFILDVLGVKTVQGKQDDE